MKRSETETKPPQSKQTAAGHTPVGIAKLLAPYGLRFVCPEHGEVTCTRIGYGCSATGWCPKCNKMLTDTEGGFAQ